MCDNGRATLKHPFYATLSPWLLPGGGFRFTNQSSLLSPFLPTIFPFVFRRGLGHLSHRGQMAQCRVQVCGAIQGSVTLRNTRPLPPPPASPEGPHRGESGTQLACLSHSNNFFLTSYEATARGTGACQASSWGARARSSIYCCRLNPRPWPYQA